MSEFEKRNYKLLTPSTDYNGVLQKLNYICEKHRDKGILQISFSKLMNGRGCYYCGREKTEASRKIELNRDEARQLCIEHDFDFVDILRENSVIYIKFVCNKHIEMGVQKMRKSNMKRGIKGCQYCRGVLPAEMAISKIKEKYPYYDIQSEFINLTSRVKCYCKRHDNTWETKPQSLLNGTGCYYCGLEKLSLHNLHTQEEFENIIHKSNPDVEVISEYKGLKEDIKVRCKKCGYEWILNANSLKNNGTRCRKCSYTYKGEDAIISILKEMDIRFVHQYSFDDCKDVRPLPFDFYLPDYNYCIEFDGRQHFEPRFGIENFNKTVEHDRIKNKYCKDKDIGLLRIPYWNADQVEDIIKKTIFTQ